MPYGLKDRELEKMCEVFASNERIERVVLYGSRAKGNYKPFSDVDITLMGEKLTHSDLNRISLAVDDLLLPYQFDISIFHTLKNEALIDHIQRIGITIYERESEWKEYKLGEIASFKTGKLNSNAAVENGAYPFFTCSPVTLSIDEYAYNQKAILLAGNNAEGNFSIKYYEGKFNAYQRTYIIESQENKCDLKFLYYSLKLCLQEFKNISQGTSTRFLTAVILNNFQILLPPLETQCRIAAILSSLDDKIDLLHRENATLEQMAETLFRQWFVEEAKEDWEEVPLGNVIKTTSGGTPSRKHSEYYENGTINWVKSKELEGTFISTTEELITEDAVANSSAKMLPEKSVLIAMYGATVGEYGILSKPMTCNQAVCALIPNKNYPYTYLYVWTALMKEDFINLASGAAQQNISQDLIKQQMVCSDIDRIKQYDEIVKGYFEKMENNQNQIRTLIETRDELLPRLMSGDVKL